MPHDLLYRIEVKDVPAQGVAPVGAPRHVYLGDPDEGRSLAEVVLPIDVPAGWRPSPALFTEPLTP